MDNSMDSDVNLDTNPLRSVVPEDLEEQHDYDDQDDVDEDADSWDAYYDFAVCELESPRKRLKALNLEPEQNPNLAQQDTLNTTLYQNDYLTMPLSSTGLTKYGQELGDRIILPPSVLNSLTILNATFPMLFELTNLATCRSIHCGVLEFVAEEGFVYLPDWILASLGLKQGDRALVKLVQRLEKGTYVKLQPHSSKFLGVSDPKAILERGLGNFSCLTAGSAVMVRETGTEFWFNVLETRPEGAVCMIDTDCECDFAPPLDYKETKSSQEHENAKKPTHQNQESEITIQSAKTTEFKPFTGNARLLDGALVSTEPAPIQPTKQPEFRPFTGNARRLDGALVSIEPDPIQSNKQLEFRPFTGNARRLDGALASTESAPANVKWAREDSSRRTETFVKREEEEERFKPFTGRSYTLQN